MATINLGDRISFKISDKKNDCLYPGQMKNDVTGDEDVLIWLHPGLDDDISKREAKNLRKVLHHRNVALYKLSGTGQHQLIFDGQQFIFTITQKYSDSSLQDRIKNFSKNFGEDFAKSVLMGMSKGLEHIHSKDILHRALRPDNIFFTIDNDPVICGFSLSKQSLEQTENSSHGHRGATDWSSPEIIAKKGTMIDKHTDVFSLGLLFYYMLSGGKHAYGDIKSSRQYYIVKGKYDLEGLKCSQPHLAKDLIEKMLNKSSIERPSVEELLRHPYFWDAKQHLHFCKELYRLTETWPNKEGVKGVLNGISPVAIDPESKEQASNWCEVLQLTSEEVIQYGTRKGVMEDLLKKAGKVPYNGSSTYSLLRFIRHRECHLDQEAKEITFSVAARWSYYLCRFPHLMHSLTDCVRKHGPAELKNFY